MAEIARYLLGGGGKRLRPALLLLSAGYAGYQGASAIHLGAVVELIHSATLIHDDVIDGADTRRGRPSANSRWGNHRSVLAGDWLYMQSFRMALDERNFKVLDILIDLTQNMVEGEVAQLSTLWRMDMGERKWWNWRRARRPACSADARGWAQCLAQLSSADEQALADYGRYAGVAFQLVDDLLDFTASPDAIGQAGAERSERRQSHHAADLRTGKRVERRRGRAGAWCAPCWKKKVFTASSPKISPRWCAIPTRWSARGCWLTITPAAPRPV